jgi:hypothetical protein
MTREYDLIWQWQPHTFRINPVKIVFKCPHGPELANNLGYIILSLMSVSIYIMPHKQNFVKIWFIAKLINAVTL